MTDAFDDLFGTRRGARRPGDEDALLAEVTLRLSEPLVGELVRWESAANTPLVSGLGSDHIKGRVKRGFVHGERFRVVLYRQTPFEEVSHLLQATGKPGDIVELQGPGRQTVTVSGAVLARGRV